jgi:hypothetical protein
LLNNPGGNFGSSKFQKRACSAAAIVFVCSDAGRTRYGPIEETKPQEDCEFCCNEGNGDPKTDADRIAITASQGISQAQEWHIPDQSAERRRCEKRSGLKPEHAGWQSQIDSYSWEGLTNERYPKMVTAVSARQSFIERRPEKHELPVASNQALDPL